jgi:ribonuclease HI
MNHENTLAALTATQDALELIAAPQRADGTYNRDRKACETLAREALAKVQALLNPSPAVAAPAIAMGAGPFTVSADGASKGNPGPASWGVIVIDNGTETFAGGGYLGVQTNNFAELTAAIEALMRTAEGAVVELITDSQYVQKGMTEWRFGWERNNWITSSKEPVKNKELWQRLLALADKRKVKVTWVRGHAGHPLNERCDQLANKAVAERAELVYE